MKILLLLLALCTTTCSWAQSYPTVVEGEAEAGALVRVTEPEYANSDVHHLLYLPKNWDATKTYPLLVELTGNKWNWGSGEVEEAHFAYSLTRGEDFILVVLPYISKTAQQNEVTWWGDEELTANYAKMVIPRIIEKYHGDKDRVVLCGFSRGAIGASYIGLRDDEIASLWHAFITHDHFDGQKEWRGTYWGAPLDTYRKAAATRLMRAKGKRWYLSFNGADTYTEALEAMGVAEAIQFTLAPIPMSERFAIPNTYFEHPHNDCWAIFDIPESRQVRKWLYQSVE